MTPIRHNYDYGTTYRQALRINWKIEDIIGGDKTLDFQQPFLPETWVDATALDFLSQTEQLTVNHIRSHSYLYLFGLVEEYILPFLVDHTRTRIHKAEQEEIRALLPLQRHLSISHFISIGYNVFISSVLTVFIALTP